MRRRSHLQIDVVPTQQAGLQRQNDAYAAIYNAAQSSYYTQQQSLATEIDTLQKELDAVDTLTLRREEHDEIMKAVLRWLLGGQVDAFMPSAVAALFANSPDANIVDGVAFTGADTGLSGSDWSLVAQYEDVVSFVNEATQTGTDIIYFLYSYFWDAPQSWEFISQLQHPDATRQAFLRAGSARVVLSVRKGWEVAWTNFVATGDPNSAAPHPYLTIAQQIQDYDSTNYPGIPAPDPNNPNPLDTDSTSPVGTTCAQAVAAQKTPVTLEVADSTGFVAGAVAIIDSFASGVQESQTITDVPKGQSVITVSALANAHAPSGADASFPVVQAGSKGLLIGEWFEYTPTSGTDIAVTSNLATIA